MSTLCGGEFGGEIAPFHQLEISTVDPHFRTLTNLNTHINDIHSYSEVH